MSSPNSFYWHLEGCYIEQDVLQSVWLPTGELVTADFQKIPISWLPGEFSFFVTQHYYGHQYWNSRVIAQTIYQHKLLLNLENNMKWRAFVENRKASKLSKGISILETSEYQKDVLDGQESSQKLLPTTDETSPDGSPKQKLLQQVSFYPSLHDEAVDKKQNKEKMKRRGFRNAPRRSLRLKNKAKAAKLAAQLFR